MQFRYSTLEPITSTEIDLWEDQGNQDYETTTIVLDLTDIYNTTHYTTTGANTLTPTESTTTRQYRTTTRLRPTRKRTKPTSTTTTEQPWNGTVVSVNTSWSSETTISQRMKVEDFRKSYESNCDSGLNFNISEQDLLDLNETDRDRLRKLCWETMFGQELVKLTVMDLVLTVISTLISDFIRALIVRY